MKQKLLAALQHLLGSVLLWEHQKSAVEKICTLLQEGGMRGLIKHPTGAGKTTLFCSIAHSLQVPTLIVVPRTGLLDQVYETLLSVGAKEEDIISSSRVATTVSEMIVSAEGKRIFLMTYQGLLSFRRSNPELYKRFHNEIEFLVADEGHTALGAKTKKAVRGEINDYEDEDQNSDSDSDLELDSDSDLDVDQEMIDITDSDEELLQVKTSLEEFTCFELFVTATPVLLEKTVQDIYGLPIIDYIRYEDLAKVGVLIVPRIVSPGKAVLSLGENDAPTSQAAMDRLSHKFLMEDGRSIYGALLESYHKEYASQNGYLPGVVFCRSIQACEEFISYAKKIYTLRLVRCTGGNEDYAEGISLEEAKRLIEANEVDLVVTVDKAGLGWDVPTLRSALVTMPMLSSAKYLQGPVGRIGRTVRDPIFPAKSRENTFIFEPEWYLERTVQKRTSVSGSESRGTTAGDESKKDEDTEKKRQGLFQGYMHLYEQGELCREAIEEYFGVDAFAALPYMFWKREEWIEHFKTVFSAEDLLNMTNVSAREWKDEITGFGMQAAYVSVGGSGNIVGYRVHRLQFGLILYPDHPQILPALELEEGKEKREQVVLPEEFISFTEVQWKAHFKTLLSAEELLEMNGPSAKAWKDARTGLKIQAACTRVGGSGNIIGNTLDRLQFALILYPDHSGLLTAMEKEKREQVVLPEEFISFTEVQWKAHFKTVLSVEELLHMKASSARAWKDARTGCKMYAACTRVGGSGTPEKNMLDRLQFGLILYPDHSGLLTAIEKEKREQVVLPEEFISFTEAQWKAYFKTVLSAEVLLHMNATSAQAWKDARTGFGMRKACTQVGGSGTPQGNTLDRLQFGLILYPDHSGLLTAIEKEKREQVVLPEEFISFTEVQWKAHFKTILSAEELLHMKGPSAQTWKDARTGFGMMRACTRVGGHGSPEKNRLHRIQFALLLYPDHSGLLAAIKKEKKEQVVLPEEFISFTEVQWKAHFKTVLSAEKLLEMNGLSAKAWKDARTGFKIQAACTRVGGSGNPQGNMLHRLQFGLLLHPDHSGLLAAVELEEGKEKREQVVLPEEFLSFTEVQWKAHFKTVLSAEELLHMKASSAQKWKDARTGFKMHAACTRVGGSGNPQDNTLDRLQFGLILYPDHSGFLAAIEKEKREQVVLPEEFLSFTEVQWKAHFKTVLSAEELLEMNGLSVKAWKDARTGFKIKAACTRVGGSGNPHGNTLHRLQFGLLLHPDHSGLLAAIEKEKREQVVLPEEFISFTEVQWKAYFKTVLSAEELLEMNGPSAQAWKDARTGSGIRKACTRVGGNGNPEKNRLHRIQFGLILHPDHPDLLAALQKHTP